MEHNTLRALILDLDGTLIDSMDMWHQIDLAILHRFGLDAPADISDAVRQMSIEESSRYFIRRFHLPLTETQFASMVEQMAAHAYAHTLPLCPGARELLSWCKAQGISLGVATATYPSLARSALERLGISDLFADIRTEQETGKPKRDAAFWRAWTGIFSCGKRQIAVADDSLEAIKAARDAGFFTIGVLEAHGKDQWSSMRGTAAVTVESLAQIPAVLR